MLQGNPYETRMEVTERAEMIRVAAKHQQLPVVPPNEGRMAQRWRSALPNLEVNSLSKGAAQLARSAWWVPAGIAIFVMLNAIIGG